MELFKHQFFCQRFRVVHELHFYCTLNFLSYHLLVKKQCIATVLATFQKRKTNKHKTRNNTKLFSILYNSYFYFSNKSILTFECSSHNSHRPFIVLSLIFDEYQVSCLHVSRLYMPLFAFLQLSSIVAKNLLP